MKIAKFETFSLSIPFNAGAKASERVADWLTLETVLVRLETDTGLVGWGEAFAYNCQQAVSAALHTMIAPLLVEQEVEAIAPLMYQLQQKLHLWGRYGITIFALSGVDIALWDLLAKQANLPLHRLLGGTARELPAYASLFFYGDPEVVAERCQHAIAQGYEYIKLHETAEREVKAAREVLGETVPLMVDTNCPWTPEQARHMALQFKPYALHWLEEPIFPPEDFPALAKLRRETGMPIAAGENACTAFQFRDMFAHQAVDYAQPSVTKVGGISEFRKVQTLAEASSVTVMPHAPYFGPGFLATLQLLAATPNPGLVERLYVQPEASLYGAVIDAVNGRFTLPTGPGLGMEPDPEVIKTYQVQN